MADEITNGFGVPTLDELTERIQGDLNAQLGDEVDARIPGTLENRLAHVVAGQNHMVYGLAGTVAREILADQARFTLARHGSLWGVAQRQATAADDGQIILTGLEGAVVPAGTELQRKADREPYVTTVEVAIDGTGSAAAPAQAVNPGTAGNAPVLTILELTSPIAGVAPLAGVGPAPFTTGSPAETLDEWRARIAARIQNPPQGGAASDYVLWALEVPGVDRAWVYPLEMGAGTVTVRFTVSGDDPIPDAGKVAEVYAYIEARRPVTAELYVVAPVPLEVDFTIEVAPDTAEVRAAVEAELAALLRRDAEPGAVLHNSQLRAAISAAQGELYHTMSVPPGDVEPDPSELPVMGDISWV